MLKLIYDSAQSGKRMNIVCFVSGSGTNYREIVKRDPSHNYLVFTNRLGCGGAAIARENGHEVIELSHVPYLKEARQNYGPGNVPRNCPERIKYEQDICGLIEARLGRMPDLVCLAGYDQWVTDWMVDGINPHMLNVHPGDTTLGFDGLYWIPSAKAIIAGYADIRSTLFAVDKGEDTGPVLVQSAPLNIISSLQKIESQTEPGLCDRLSHIDQFVTSYGINSYDEFTKNADAQLATALEHICRLLQDELKIAGDWQIYPFAVHDLIASGRAAIDGRKIFVDGKELPAYGYRLDSK